jgi:hypothetical protein
LQPIDSYKGVKVVVANTDGSRQSLIPVSDRHVAFEKKVNEIKMIQHRKAHQQNIFLFKCYVLNVVAKYIAP